MEAYSGQIPAAMIIPVLPVSHTARIRCFSNVGQVRMTMGKVEERLWSIIRNFADLGRDRPAMLVNAVRIIELQELVDQQPRVLHWR